MGNNTNLGNDVHQSLYKFEKDSEVKLLKDMIAEERGKREHGLEEHYKLYAQLQQVVHGLENEVMKKLKEHRSDQLQIFSNGEEERQRLEKLKMDRAESDT